MVVAPYVEKLLKDGLSKPTVKQHRAAIRIMVTGGILAMNSASAVRGPKYVIRKGKAPVFLTVNACAPGRRRHFITPSKRS
jgi:integrase/recombinase XerD